MQIPLSLLWVALVNIATAGIFLLALGWGARHYFAKVVEELKEFTRGLIAELIKATNTKFAYRDEQIRLLNRHHQMDRHRVTQLALTTAELGAVIMFPGPTPSRAEQDRVLKALQNIAVQRGIEPEELEKLNDDWTPS